MMATSSSSVVQMDSLALDAKVNSTIRFCNAKYSSRKVLPARSLV